jgi:hypothetical protein
VAKFYLDRIYTAHSTHINMGLSQCIIIIIIIIVISV